MLLEETAKRRAFAGIAVIRTDYVKAALVIAIDIALIIQPQTVTFYQNPLAFVMVATTNLTAITKRSITRQVMPTRNIVIIYLIADPDMT